jgi:hypothetical protein
MPRLPTLDPCFAETTGTLGVRGQASRTILVVLAIIVGVIIAQLGGRVAIGSSENEPPEMIAIPPYEGDVDRDSRQDVVDFARAAPYANELGFGDEQSLRPPPDTISRDGPYVRVEPVASAHRYSADELTVGRFVGRLINLDPTPYPRLGLGAFDTTYIWVDSSSVGQWRVVFFSTDPAIQPVTRPVRVEPSTRWWQSLARWVVVGGVDEVWTTCGVETVCRTD